MKDRLTLLVHPRMWAETNLFTSSHRILTLLHTRLGCLGIAPTLSRSAAGVKAY